MTASTLPTVHTGPSRYQDPFTSAGSAAPRPDGGRARDLASGKDDRPDQSGTLVGVHVTTGALVIAPGTGLGAVSMPARLGARVREELGIALLSGPVLADPSGLEWTFLTERAAAVRPTVRADLLAIGVRLVPAGSPLVIPPGAAVPGDRAWRWIEPPVRARPLPPANAVIAVTRRIAAGARRSATR